MKRAELKAAILERGSELIEHLIAGRDRVGGEDDFKIRCVIPGHDERTASLQIHLGEGWWKCFGGCDTGGDALALLAAVERLDITRDFPRVLDKAAAILHLDADRPEPPAKKDPPVLAKPLTADPFCAAYGLTVEDFTRAGFKIPVSQRIPIAQLDGPPVFTLCVCAMYPVELPDGGRAQKYKTLARDQYGKRLMHIPEDTKGNTGIIGCLAASKLGGKRLVLAGGEEKLLAAEKAGFHAVCLQNGEKAPTGGQAQMIIEAEPAEVVIAYDNDEAGQKGTINAAIALYEAGCPRVSRVAWPSGMRQGIKDLNDYLLAYGLDKLSALIAAAEYMPPASLDIGPLNEGPDVSDGLPRFPVEKLPFWMRNFITEATKSLEVPMESIALGVLSAVGAAVNGRLRVLVHSNYSVCVNLYAACVLPPSERKSAVIGAIQKPIIEYEAKKRGDHAKAVARAKVELSVANTKLKNLEKKGGGLGHEGIQDEMAEVTEKIGELEEIKRSLPPTLIFGNVTPESLVIDFKNNKESGAIIEPEADVLLNFFGRYSKTGQSNLELILKAHGGERFARSRVGAPPILLVHPILTIFLTPQRTFLTQMPNEEAHGRGLLGRFLWSIPKFMVGSRPCNLEPIEYHAEKLYLDCVTRICEAPDPEKQFVFKLRPAEIETLREYHRAIEPRLHPFKGDLGGEFAEWGGKSDAKVLKLAGILQVAARVELAGIEWWTEEYLAPQFLRAAIEIVMEWAIPNAKAAYSLMGIENKQEADTVEEAILNWLADRPSERTPKREIQQKFFKKGANGKSELDRVLKGMETQKHIYTLVNKPEGRGRPSELIILPSWKRKGPKAGAHTPDSLPPSPEPEARSDDSTPFP